MVEILIVFFVHLFFQIILVPDHFEALSMASSSFTWVRCGVPKLTWPQAESTPGWPLGHYWAYYKKYPRQGRKIFLNGDMEAWIILKSILEEMWPYFISQASKTGHVSYRSIFLCYYIHIYIFPWSEQTH